MNQPDALHPSPPRRPSEQVPHSFCALGQDLERMPVEPEHDLEYRLDPFIRNSFLKKIGHGTDEDHLRLSPAQRLLENLHVQSQLVGADNIFRPTQPYIHPLGIAVSAAWRDLY